MKQKMKSSPLVSALGICSLLVIGLGADAQLQPKPPIDRLTTGLHAPRLAAGSLASGEPRGRDPSVAGRGFMPRPRRGGREADEIGRPSEGGTRSGSPSELTGEIVRLEKASGGTVGLGAVHLETGRSVGYNADVRFPMASTYKVPIAVQLLSRVEKGEVRLTDMITIEKSDLHPGSGTIAQLLTKPGVVLSLHNLLELMLIVSDNSAADLCLESAGGSAAVTRRMRELGIDAIDVSRPTFVSILNSLGITIFKEGDAYDEVQAFGALSRVTEPMRQQAWLAFLDNPRDTATPAAMAGLLQKVWAKEALSDDNTQLLLDIMKRCQTGKDRIRGLLPPGTLVFNKTGTINKVSNDVGIVELPDDAGHIVLAIFIKDTKLESSDADNIIANLARSVYDYFLFSENGKSAEAP
jgi:beta-lactamase class A